MVIGRIPAIEKTTAKPLRVVIADSHTLLRAGLRLLLEKNPRYEAVVVGEADNGLEAIKQVLELRPDALIVDLVLPKLDGLEVLRRIQPIQSVRKIVLTDAIADMTTASKLGVSGIVSKKAPHQELIQCLGSKHTGSLFFGSDGARSVTALSSPWREQKFEKPFRLTKRETEILQAIVVGRRNAEIAEQLCISKDTVKHHVTNLFNKTGASNRLELALFAIEKKLVDISCLEIGTTTIDLVLTRRRSA